MKHLVISVILLATARFCLGGPLRLEKRAAFYIANETACVVDSMVYSNGDPIPTDDPCEACKCRPPGFACVLKECEVKPGCRAVRRAGHCCPEYICGCEHNGRMYRDGDEIQDSQNPCYTCHCQGSSIACAFVDCFFRVDCAPEYVTGECCPRYTHCSSVETNTSGVDITSFAIKTDSDAEVTTISGTPTETIQQYESEAERASSETSLNEPIEKEAPVEPSVEPEIVDPIHFIADTISKEYAPETHERGSNSESPDEKDAITTAQPIQKEDKVQEGTSEIDDKLDLFNTDSEIKEPIEEPKKKEDGIFLESTTVISDISTSFETTISKANVEIFTEETPLEHKFDATTVTQNLPSNEPKTTEAPVTKDEAEIETNVIEKKFRSLENATLEHTKSEATENEKGTPTYTEADPTTVPVEKPSTFQEIRASTRIPEADSPEALKPKDTTISDQTTNADKSLYYNIEEKVLEALGTVSAMVNVHEETSSENAVITSTSMPSSNENLSIQTDIPKETIGYENVDRAFSEIPY